MDIELHLIDSLINSYGTDSAKINQFLQLIEKQPTDYYGKTNCNAHITSSALIFNEEHTHVLLVHHRKFDKWLQPGGHWMDEGIKENVFESALREVIEEAYNGNSVAILPLNKSQPLDLDIHLAGDHKHYDIAFLAQINQHIPLTVTKESRDVQWISIEHILAHTENYDARLVNMINKGLEIVQKMTKKIHP